MSESKHAPEPWTARDTGKPGELVIWAGEDASALVATVHVSATTNENARLIEAAPGLLDACKEALPVVEAAFDEADEGPLFEAMDALRQAIAKATGAEA